MGLKLTILYLHIVCMTGAIYFGRPPHLDEEWRTICGNLGMISGLFEFPDGSHGHLAGTKEGLLLE